MFDVDLIPGKIAGEQATQRYFYSDPLMVAHEKLTGLLRHLISQQRIFFPWDYQKGKVCETRPASIPDLKQ
jgi:hypothetical protein